MAGKLRDKLVFYLVLALTIGPFLLGMYLREYVFLPTHVIVMTLIAGGVACIAIFNWILRKDPYRHVSAIIYGAFVGCLLSFFALVSGNHYFRNNEKFDIKTDILRTGRNIKKHGNCGSVYAIVMYDGIRHEVTFHCRYYESLQEYRQVRLTLSKGLFGYYVIEDRELLK